MHPKKTQSIKALLFYLLAGVIMIGWLIFYSGKGRVERITRAGNQTRIYSAYCGHVSLIPTNKQEKNNR